MSDKWNLISKYVCTPLLFKTWRFLLKVNAIIIPNKIYSITFHSFLIHLNLNILCHVK